ncbi:MAG: polyprenyl synthetase family protein [Ignavibacteriaceae bacterium]|nr:polyprenyl synthetase family protein [Ignavibacteriaceae bacterium]
MESKAKSFEALYDRERKKVDALLVKALKNRKPQSLYNPGSYIIAGGGKRLRPLLILFSAKAAGGKFKDAYNAAAAVELLHNFTLVHDDIMDNADMRRGRLTLHKKYDINTAILVGDSLLSIAYEYLLKDCNGNSKAVITSFTKSLVEVCEGQSMDKEFETAENVTIEEYITMIRKKTAALSQMCCEVGALIGGGKSKVVNALSKFGRYIGIAFQIQDDLLDITANQAEFGKIIGGDLVEGKKTFLFLEALSKSSGEEREKLLAVIKRKGVDKSEIPDYKLLYEKLGVIDDARREIKKYTSKAIKSLNVLKKKEDREIFHWLADSLIKRNK